jgi:hypothetical protein
MYSTARHRRHDRSSSTSSAHAATRVDGDARRGHRGDEARARANDEVSGNHAARSLPASWCRDGGGGDAQGEHVRARHKSWASHRVVSSSLCVLFFGVYMLERAPIEHGKYIRAGEVTARMCVDLTKLRIQTMHLGPE